MKIIFACGGTAGHINPAIAIADTLRAQNPETEILFVGNPNRMEATLVPEAGYRFSGVLVEGFHRSFSPKSIIHNVKSVYYMLKAGSAAKKIIQQENPDIIVGTGGYVSGPVLRTGAKMGIKTITHESNAFPGVTTKLLVGHVDKVLLAVEDSKKFLPESDKYMVTGNPVRPEILAISKKEAKKKLGIGDRICVLSYGGSNGAEKINNAMAEAISLLLPQNISHHIHATGRFGTESFPKRLVELGVDVESENLDIREYISNMAECLAAADLVICRSGAMTICELEALGRAAILIPSPNVAENHQYHNAMALVKHNAAVLLEEKDLTGQSLYELINELIKDTQELENIGRNAKSMMVANAAEEIAKIIYQLYEETL